MSRLGFVLLLYHSSTWLQAYAKTSVHPISLEILSNSIVNPVCFPASHALMELLLDAPTAIQQTIGKKLELNVFVSPTFTLILQEVLSV